MVQNNMIALQGRTHPAAASPPGAAPTARRLHSLPLVGRMWRLVRPPATNLSGATWVGVPAKGRRAAPPRTPHPSLRATIEAANARAVRGTALPPRSHKGRRKNLVAHRVSLGVL